MIALSEDQWKTINFIEKFSGLSHWVFMWAYPRKFHKQFIDTYLSIFHYHKEKLLFLNSLVIVICVISF